MTGSHPPLSNVPATLPEALARLSAHERELHHLRADNQQLSTLAHHQREGLLLLDAATTIVFANDQYCQLLELPLPAAQWLGQPMEALIGLVLERVQDPAAYVEELTQARKNPISQLNALLPLRNGRVLERDVLQVPLGESTGWLLSYRDVTTQCEAQNQLRLISRIPEQNPNPVLRFNAAGEQVYANPAAFRFHDHLAGAEYAALRTRLKVLAVRALHRNQSHQTQVCIGRHRLQASVVAFADEAYVNIYLVDVTGRYQVEQQRDEQRRFYEGVLDALPADVFVLDAEERYLYANYAAVPDAALRRWMLGRTNAEYNARRGRPDSLTASQRARFEQVCATGQPVQWTDQVLGADGPGHRLRVLQPVLGPGGQLARVIGYGIDITEREQARQEQLTQQEFYETVLNALPSPIAVFGPDYRYRFINATAVPDPAARQLLLGQSVAEFAVHHGWRTGLVEERRRYFQQAEQQGRQVGWQETNSTPDGAVTHALRYYQPVFGPSGALWFMIGYSTDITERVRAEQQLREQQQFTELVLDTSPSVIYVRDAAGQVHFANRAMRELQDVLGDLAGRAAQNPAGREAQELAHYAQADAQVLATGVEATAEDLLTLPSGEARWFQSVKCPLPRPDGTVQVLGVSTDITALKQAQHTLERSEKQYRDLMQYAQALICTYTLDGTVLSVNPALATMLNKPAGELVGRPMATYLLPEDQPIFGDYLARIAAEGEAEGVSRVVPWGQQRPRYLLYRNFMVREAGQQPYIISHSHDITDRIQAEQQTQRACEEAEATARARENFLANMSHEIRTPMNGVLGMTTQLARTRLDARQQELVRIIQASGQHLLAVLNDVLDMAKITAGKLDFEQKAFNLCDSMGAAVQPLALQAREKGLEFVGVPLRDTCPMPWVLGDAHRLNQVLINLVGNAVKFTRQGRIKMVGELLSESETTLTVRFSVQDTGPGISADKQAHIFESFTQAYADTARHHGGTGLGLSISRALVEQMGGQLTLESQLGQGSTFAFMLTLLKAVPPAPAPAPATYDTGRLAGTRVLLVEDNDINRMVARMLLEPWGTLLDEAIDGPAALVLLEQHRYDVVLMDIQLPGMSGVEVTQRLRQLPDPARARTPVIALSANAFRTDVESYLAAGLNDYLAKPFDEAALYRKIAALLPPSTVPDYDLTQLRQLAQGRPVFVEKIIRSFLDNMPASVQQLRAAAHLGDWREVARLVHHVKPNLLALAVAGTHEPVAVLEQLHYAAPVPARLPEAAEFGSALEQLLTAIERALRELPTELPPPDGPGAG